MKKNKSIVSGCALIMVFCLNVDYLSGQVVAQPQKEAFTYPAEFEKQEAIWLSWATYSFMSGEPLDKAVLQTMKELTPYVKINLMVTEEGLINGVKKRLRENGINERQVNFIVYPVHWFSIRDPNPMFLRGNRGTLKAVDFGWNEFGMQPLTHPRVIRTEKRDREIAAQLGLPVVKSDLVSEGGAREVNGKGTMVLVEAVDLQRNPNLTKEQIEKEFMKILNLKKIIWLKKGLVEDDLPVTGKLPGDIYHNGSGGHIDTFCRFADERTILLAEVSPKERDADPISKINYERMEENYRILRQATDQNGMPFKIVRIPVSDLMTDSYVVKESDKHMKAGDTIKYALVTGYLNYIVANGIVLTAKYWKEGRPASTKRKDEEAKKILQKVFPGRKIVQIDVESMNHDGGGLHCASMDQPAIINE